MRSIKQLSGELVRITLADGLVEFDHPDTKKRLAVHYKNGRFIVELETVHPIGERGFCGKWTKIGEY